MEPWVRKKGLLKRGVFVTQLTAPEWDVIVKLIEHVGGSLVARRESAPVDELAQLTGLTVGHAEPPSDDGLAVLLPDFEREEYTDGENSVLRQLHEPDILDAKVAHLMALSEVVVSSKKTVQVMRPEGPSVEMLVEVPFDQAPQIVAGFNDLRLYLAADRMPTDYPEPRDPDDPPREHPYGDEQADSDETFLDYPKDIIIEFLGFCQDSLLRAMMGDDLP